PDHHGGRRAGRLPPRRRRADGDGVRVARRGYADGAGDPRPRFPARAGLRARRRAELRPRQPRRRLALRVGRSAHPLRVRLRRPARRNRLAVAAAAGLLAAVLAAALAPWLPLSDPDAVDTTERLRPILSPGHVLGTDEFGRDLLARLVWGAR